MTRSINSSTALPEGGASPQLFDISGRRVFVAGHRGLVGSAIARRLARVGCDLVTVNHQQLDLIRQE